MQIDKVSTITMNSVSLKSGDLMCTYDGSDTFLAGQIWWLIGKFIPGDVDHILIYTGPGNLFVEANGDGVVAFEMPDATWDASKVKDKRGGLLDNFYGAIYPLKDSGKDTDTARLTIANYCLTQAALQKKYNLEFTDAETEDSFYCSQLAYKAYQTQGINLNTGMGVPNVLGTDKIVFPQEIWEGFPHQKGN